MLLRRLLVKVRCCLFITCLPLLIGDHILIELFYGLHEQQHTGTVTGREERQARAETGAEPWSAETGAEPYSAEFVDEGPHAIEEGETLV